MKKSHTNGVAQLRKRLKAERAPKGVKVGSVGHFYDVTELQFKNGSRPYERLATGQIRKVFVLTPKQLERLRARSIRERGNVTMLDDNLG